MAGKVEGGKKSIRNVSLVVAVGPHPCWSVPYGKRIRSKGERGSSVCVALSGLHFERCSLQSGEG